MKAASVIKLMEEKGWVFVRQSGSHKIFKHPDHIRPCVVPEHGKKDLPDGTLNSILKQTGIKK